MTDPSIPDGPVSAAPRAPDGAPPVLDEAALYRAMVESALDYAIFATSLDGIVMSWSAGAQRLMGWAPEEIVGQEDKALFTAADIERGQPDLEMRAALEHGRAVNERWHVRRDGSRFFGTGLLMPMRHDGRVVGFVKVMRDRTGALPVSVPATDGLAARENPAPPADPDARRQLNEVMRLKALAEAAGMITAAPTLADTLQAVADAVRNLVGAHQAVVSVTRGADHQQDIASVSLSERYAQQDSHDARTDGSDIHTLVTRTNQPMRMTQAQLEAHLAWRDAGAHAARQRPMAGWLAVPLARSDGRNLGLIQLSDRYENEFDEADQAIVMQLAQFASTAIEQAEAREALARSEERLRLAIEATQLGTWHFDSKAGRLDWDERCRALFGLPADAPVDYGVFLRGLHPEDRDRADAAVQTALRPDSDGRFEMEYRTIGLRDGIERWIAAHGQASCDGLERVGLIGTVLDVSARKRAEQALRDSEARFSLAAQSSSLGQWEIDPQTQQLHWSDNACRMWGFEDCAIVAFQQVLQRLHPEDRARIEAQIADAWNPAGSGEFRAQYRVLWPDGSLRWLDALAVSEFVGQGDARHAVRFAGIVWDVTETRRLIESLQQADARKDEFLAMLAHELRNPLAALTNALRLLSHGQPDGARQPGNERKMLDIAERQVRQLRRLVDDLLEVSRITRGKIELRPERVRVQDAVRDAVEVLAAEIEQRGQRLALRLPDSPVHVFADPARMAQVLENLLNNASKYTPEGGLIRIDVEDLPASGRSGASEVVIRVADNGIGIAPEELPRLFDLFTQVDATLDRSQGGLGIGLAMVKRLAEMHGGSVSAASPGRGRGATFTVRLPRAER